MTALRSKPVAVTMTEQEVRDIDDIRFTHRFPSRSEVIRTLIAEGMKTYRSEDTAGEAAT